MRSELAKDLGSGCMRTPEVRFNPKGATEVNVFFVGGIHGSGKSTLGRQLVGPLRADHVIASDLIEYTPDSHDPTKKSVANVVDNQVSLLREFSLREQVRPNVVLDGHFCVLENAGHIVRIPLNVFREIDPIAMVLVEAEPTDVQARLRQRESAYDLNLIKRLMFEEHSHAESVSRELGVPLKVWRGGHRFRELVEFLQRASRKG